MQFYVFTFSLKVFLTSILDPTFAVLNKSKVSYWICIDFETPILQQSLITVPESLENKYYVYKQ